MRTYISSEFDPRREKGGGNNEHMIQADLNFSKLKFDLPCLSVEHTNNNLRWAVWGLREARPTRCLGRVKSRGKSGGQEAVEKPEEFGADGISWHLDPQTTHKNGRSPTIILGVKPILKGILRVQAADVCCPRAQPASKVAFGPNLDGDIPKR